MAGSRAGAYKKLGGATTRSDVRHPGDKERSDDRGNRVAASELARR